MGLPELLPPSGTPCFLLAGHANTPDSLYDECTPLQGEGRKRRVQTYAPRVVSVSLDLSDEQAFLIDDWFENVLVVGNERFTAEIAGIGAGPRFWEAQWVAPPQWTPRAAREGVRWRLTGQLLLTGEGGNAAPTTTTLAVEYLINLTGSAAISAPVEMAVEYSIDLLGVNPFAVEYQIDLEAVIAPSNLLREDGSALLREDGSHILRE